MLEPTQVDSKKSSNSRVLVFTDWPAIGNVAGRVALPALLNHRCLPQLIPTCLVSGHGGFKGAQVFPYPDFFAAALALAAEVQLSPAWAISGFFPNASTIAQLESWLKLHPALGLTVDPVMADNGRLYGILEPSIIPAMGRLVRLARVITPNITEAALLLGQPPSARPQNLAEAHDWLTQLAALGPQAVVLTSLELPELPNSTGLLAYDATTQTYHHYHSPRLHYTVPGAGDYFAAVLSAGCACHLSFAQALEQAWNSLQSALSQPPQLIQQGDGTMMSEGIHC